MLSAFLSFFGGSAFRMLWGEISAAWTRHQDHKHELERLRLQADMDAAAHARNLEAVRLQAELGVQVIRVQGEADVGRAEANAWQAAVESIGRPSGIWLVDLWNGVIRPFLATVCTVMVLLHFWRAGWVLDDQGWALVGAVLGIYVADRTLFKRGK
jgi:hypothetical protein